MIKRRGHGCSTGLTCHRTYHDDVSASAIGHVVKRRRSQLQRHSHIDVNHPMKPLMPNGILVLGQVHQNSRILRQGVDLFPGK